MYYCPLCKKEATSITEIYHEVKEHRQWDGDCYELINTSLEEPDKTICSVCKTEVEGCSDE